MRLLDSSKGSPFTSSVALNTIMEDFREETLRDTCSEKSHIRIIYRVMGIKFRVAVVTH